MKQDLAQQYLDIAGVILVALNTKGEITLINKRGCEVLGYEEKELIGRNWFDKCLPASERGRAEKVFRRLMTGEIEAEKYGQNSVLTKSGEERFISWHNAVLADEAGNPIGTLSSGEDITDRKRTESALQESEARIRAIVETAVDGIITIDKHGIIESFNRAAERLFGYSVKEAVGKNITLLMPSPYHEEHDGYLSNYLRTGQRKIIGIGREVIGKRKDGTTFPIYLAVSEIDLGDRQIFTGMVRDLTRQKRLQEQILQSERLAVIGKMAAKVAHEIRNPLSSVSLNAELLEDEIRDIKSPDKGEAESLLQAMIQEIDRVAALTDEYLQFSRLPGSQPAKSSFKNLIAEVQVFTENELLQKNIEFEFHDSKPPFKVYLDRIQFRRVLLNLIRNAIESMPKGGKLKIWEERAERTGILYIRDTGIGIPAEKVQHIFEPFFTTKDFGTGLGLAVTQQIVHEHGGQISCESPSGQGTTFKIELPLHTERGEDRAV